MLGRKTNRWGESGFTLVEMIIVVGIIGILLAVATLYFYQMTKKAQIEKETRQLFADMNNARTQAMFSKKPSSMWFQPQSYRFVTYSSESEDPTIPTNGRTVTTTSVHYALTFTAANGLSLVNPSVLFDVTGMTTAPVTGLPITINLNPTNSAAFDCVMLDMARTNMGNMLNGTCILK
jgi:type II secretion system protein H